jgi:predicted HicB family RNase H-like nuclease
MSESKETITAKVPSEMRHKIRVEAAKADMSMSEWIRQAAEERLGEENRYEPSADD